MFVLNCLEHLLQLLFTFVPLSTIGRPSFFAHRDSSDIVSSAVDVPRREWRPAVSARNGPYHHDITTTDKHSCLRFFEDGAAVRASPVFPEIRPGSGWVEGRATLEQRAYPAPGAVHKIDEQHNPHDEQHLGLSVQTTHVAII
jgi:hypothetical protein